MANYIPNTKAQAKKMLDIIGLGSEEELFSGLPQEIVLKRDLEIDDELNEIQVKKKMDGIAKMNKVFSACFLGSGVYNHFIPSVVKQLASKSEFATAYTPYQAEISQGVLQAIFEYQTMMCSLTGLDASNASVYDGATAAAEAAMMCVSNKKNKIIVSDGLNPQYIQVLKTWCEYCEVEMQMLGVKDYKSDLSSLDSMLDKQVGAVIMQNPNFFGSFEEMQEASDITHGKKCSFVAVVNPISLALCKAPGEYGADIAVGDGQGLGNPMAGGGPYLGFMTATKKLMRKLPGRIVGQTSDTNGKRGFVLTLQAREQHIRREKASSNICSNQALNALTAAMYLGTMGNEGLIEVASTSMNMAHLLREKMIQIDGVSAVEQDFFNEFVVEINADIEILEKALWDNDILGGLHLGGNKYLYCATELNSINQIEKIVKVIKKVCNG